jgi:hypothetical protein
VSSAATDDRHTGDGPGPELTGRLGYLLKHARLWLRELTAAALAPYGLDGRELAVLPLGGRPEPRRPGQPG